MKEVIGLLPANKYLPGLGMLTTFQTCLGVRVFFNLLVIRSMKGKQLLQKCGSSMDKAMTNIGGAFKKQLQPLFKKVEKIIQRYSFDIDC